MSGIFYTVDDEGAKDLIIPTVLRVGKEEIEYWTSMTCFYDKNWEFESDLATVPISFMHITSVTEIITAQGAEKRVILYEAPDTVSRGAGFDVSRSHPASENNLKVIMDNVVVQPKQYQMEVIIPDSLIGPYHKQGLARMEALLAYMGLTEAKGTGAEFRGLDMDSIANALRVAQVFVDTVETASNLIGTLASGFTGSSQMNTVNKNSLQAMASRGHVVLFKKWTGYDYSYGIITKVDISKKPSENGVYRGSITFQETPILNISQKKVSSVGGIAKSALASATKVAKILNLAMAYPFIQSTGVMDEAGAPGSKTADGGEFYDIF